MARCYNGKPWWRGDDCRPTSGRALIGALTDQLDYVSLLVTR
jgi:hypothetical protein